MKYIDLNGNWELFLFPVGKKISSPSELDNATPLEAAVPGNIELDLLRAGLVREPFTGTNALDCRKYEEHDFWYRKTFEADFTGSCELVLEGVDCFAEVFLNGEKIGSCENAFIPHRFPAVLQKNNTLAIRIISAEIMARKFPDISGRLCHYAEVHSSLYPRRPAHSTGWDILPRLCLGGLWKNVRVEKRLSPYFFNDVWLWTRNIDKVKNTAQLRLFYHFSAGEESLQNCTLKFRMSCKSSVWEKQTPAYFTSGVIDFELASPELWYPRAYGDPNLYQLEAALLSPDGILLASHSTSCGIRTIELDRSESNVEGDGRFLFKVNGQPVRICGSNHVPFDALHSRDESRMEKVLAIFDELQCNMIRCWGGGVYESDKFYDWCDRHGILVWQDFMFACGFYPQNEIFFNMVRPEIESVVKRLRRHPSLALYCGDNECDESSFYEGLQLKMNRLTREVIPQIIHLHDPSRPYLPSSPYVPEKLQEQYSFADAVRRLPERHLWGSREHFKLPLYAEPKVQFISETGWIGAPSLSSLKKFITPEHLKLDTDDPEWAFHSTNPFGSESVLDYRRSVIIRQLQEYFGRQPEDLIAYIRASQIFQAEALKFQVETVRLSKTCTGLLWWNAVDGWPQIAEAAVDYYLQKKLAFHYLKRSQSPFVICCSEPDPWNSKVVAVNDSCRSASGTFSVTGENGELLSGEFSVPPFSSRELGAIRSRRGENALWLIKWLNCGKNGCNHYISGNRQMELDWYMTRLPQIAALDDAFDAENFGL